MIRLTGLWKSKTKSGDPMLSGNLGGGRIVILPNTRRQEGTKQPTHYLFIAENERQRQGDQGQDSAPPAAPPDAYQEDDIPF